MTSDQCSIWQNFQCVSLIIHRSLGFASGFPITVTQTNEISLVLFLIDTEQWLLCAISCTIDLTANTGKKFYNLLLATQLNIFLGFLSLNFNLLILNISFSNFLIFWYYSGQRFKVFLMTLISVKSLRGREKSKVPFKVLSLLGAIFVSDEMCHISRVQHGLSDVSCHITSSIMCHIM